MQKGAWHSIFLKIPFPANRPLTSTSTTTTPNPIGPAATAPVSTKTPHNSKPPASPDTVDPTVDFVLRMAVKGFLNLYPFTSYLYP